MHVWGNKRSNPSRPMHELAAHSLFHSIFHWSIPYSSLVLCPDPTQTPPTSCEERGCGVIALEAWSCQWNCRAVFIRIVQNFSCTTQSDVMKFIHTDKFVILHEQLQYFHWPRTCDTRPLLFAWARWGSGTRLIPVQWLETPYCHSVPPSYPI